MARKTWVDFEDRVRDVASHIWGRPCEPRHIGGVDVDGVTQLEPELYNLIEITEEKSLGKVRQDIIKLQTAKANLYAKGILARCHCIVNGNITNSMKEAGEAAHVRVLSFDDFSKQFFDFDRYRAARIGAPFGSAVNPLTGVLDDTPYVSVSYVAEKRRDAVSSEDVANFLKAGKNVILLGEYGTGKSRCIQEVFRHLSSSAAQDFCWGLSP